MAEIVRVARDKSAVIVKTDSGYRIISENLEPLKSASTLEQLLVEGSWRRASKSDTLTYSRQLEFADGGIVVESQKERTYRAPKTLQMRLRRTLLTSPETFSDDEFLSLRRISTEARISLDDVKTLSAFFEKTDKEADLRGGTVAREWVRKIIENPETIVASAFVSDESLEYFAVSNSGSTEEVNSLIAVDRENDLVLQWAEGAFVPLPNSVDSIEFPSLFEIDDETAAVLSERFDGSEKIVDITSFNADERNLIDLAYADIDWEELDRTFAIIADASGYSPVERSQNAQRQIRTGDGKFGGDQIGQGTELGAFAKSTLPEGFVPVPDPAALIQQYLESVGADAIGTQPAPAEDGTIVAAGPAGEVAPLYLAVVDSVDKTAVTDLVAVIPEADGSPSAWKRSGAEWVEASELLADLQGATPPPVVHIEDEGIVRTVLSDVDAYDAQQGAPVEEAPAPPVEDSIVASAWELAPETAAGRKKAAQKGIALPDGSFPITDEEDLKNAVQAFGRAKDKDAAKRHIKKRARALNRTDLIPDDWKTASVFDDSHLTPLYGEFGETVAMVAAGVPGVADAPSDHAAVERLREYWSTGAGAAKIRWGTEGDLTRCHRNLTKYVGPERAWGYCQNLHKRIFGVTNATKDKD